MYKPYAEYLLTLNAEAKYRRLGRVSQDSIKNFLDFSTNDYLALSRNKQVIEASINASKQYGLGTTGSRLISGNTSLHEEFEAVIAKDKHTEASLIFNSGFQANESALSSLLDEKILKAKPLVFFDKLNHSSLYQAIFLSKPELYRYHHNDMNNLESLLQEHKNDTRPKFIVTETIFSMDGDIVPLEQIITLAKHYNAFLYLDEAHATGVLGPKGYGLSTTVDLQEIPHAIMGTFSKALGSSGGYVACNDVIRNFLINKAPGFIYSTSPSPAIIGGAFKAWKMLESLYTERRKLQELGGFLRKQLKKLGFDIGNSSSHIVPIILGDEKTCLQTKEALLEEGIIVSAIRPPTVPPNSSRLRISLTTEHKVQDIEKLLASLQKRKA